MRRLRGMSIEQFLGWQSLDEEDVYTSKIGAE